MEPLAYILRPKNFSEIVGQNHLVGKDGIITKMIEKQKPLSFILYGLPGTGKTTIAKIFSQKLSIESYEFNAATDNKQILKDYINQTKYGSIILIIDEIHRMNKDIQDYLLPFLENGKVIGVGLTTLNPYFSINEAIRSRMQIFELNELKESDLINLLRKGLNHLEIKISASDNVLKYIIIQANKDIRQALNILESSALYLEDGDILNINIVNKVKGIKSQKLDADLDNYFHLLSAFQKSIRGSDVDASIHYLARLITLGDLDSILRRMVVIGYEDIGLANPNIGPKLLAAFDLVKKIGLPEARIILSQITIEMALSPKSNSSYLALDKALNDYSNIDTGDVPNYLKNEEIKKDPSIYNYPHDDNLSINDQTYLPNKIKDKRYYIPKNSSNYEKLLSERLKLIDEIKKIKR